jgi:hypothetical protein
MLQALQVDALRLLTAARESSELRTETPMYIKETCSIAVISVRRKSWEEDKEAFVAVRPRLSRSYTTYVVVIPHNVPYPPSSRGLIE